MSCVFHSSHTSQRFGQFINGNWVFPSEALSFSGFSFSFSVMVRAQDLALWFVTPVILQVSNQVYATQCSMPRAVACLQAKSHKNRFATYFLLPRVVSVCFCHTVLSNSCFYPVYKWKIGFSLRENLKIILIWFELIYILMVWMVCLFSVL